jgi:RecA/RadA recombinase
MTDATKAIKAFHEKLGKTYGEDTFSRSEIRKVSTGVPAIDFILRGGIPVHRTTMLVGMWSTGKSLLLAYILAEIQKAGGIAYLCDTEGAFHPSFGEMVGLDIEALHDFYPKSLEEGFAIIADIIKQSKPLYGDRLIGIGYDGLAGVSTEAELKQISAKGFTYKDNTRAQRISAAVRFLNEQVRRNNVALLYTNQLRQDFSGNSVTPGGRAVPYESSLTLKSYIAGRLINSEGKAEGVNLAFNIDKSKVCPPYRKATLRLLWNEGFAPCTGLAEVLCEEGVIKLAGSWYTLPLPENKEIKFQGAPKAEEYLNNNPQIVKWYLDVVIKNDEEKMSKKKKAPSEAK